MNPNQILNMVMQNPNIKNNPIINNAMQMAQQGNVRELQMLANNIAKERGIDVNTIKKQIESNLQIKI